MAAPEPNFRKLFESAPALCLVLAPDFSIVAMSDAYARAIGIGRDDVVGRRIFEIFAGDPSDASGAAVANLRASLERVLELRQPDTMAAQPFRIRKPQAESGFEEREWSSINAPVLGDDGAVEHIIHRLEEPNPQLAAAHAQAAQANAELETFSYSVAHDLRAPLRSIHGFSEILVEEHAGQLDAQGKDYVERVLAASDRMGELIDDLLVLSRATRASLRREPIDLGAIARSVFAALSAPGSERNVDLVVEGDLRASADPRLTQTILENLIDNARKFSVHESVARIEVGAFDKDDERIFFVRDNGVGFDMSHTKNLFGPFQRLHAANEYEGHGIGLATVQRLVHRHGGRIWADAALGRGAAFFFTLAGRAAST